jgi:phosphohistidine phosphatase SixA
MSSIAPRAQVLSVVRHAEAGDRERFVGDDSLRPLSRQGRRQANALGKRLGEGTLDLITSPYLRCVETISPASSRLRRAMMLASWLVEGEPADEALYQLVELTGEIGGLVACTHQDLMVGMFDVAIAAGAVASSEPIFEKAATAEFTVVSGKVVAVSFVAPPKI